MGCVRRSGSYYEQPLIGGYAVRKWLRGANLWQRLWFVASVLFISYATLLWPLMEAAKTRLSTWNYTEAIEKEFRNPDCLAYQTEPVTSLEEPEYSEIGSTCYHVYLSRQYDSTTPYTLEAYQQNRSAQYWNSLFVALAIGLVGSVLLSAIVYGLGALLRWIIFGYKEQAVD